MQFHHSTPPQNVRIRGIPTIRLQTMKHPRRNCMRNCEGGAEACCGTRGWRKGQAPRKVARNSIEQSFNKVRKRCNSNDLNSMFEIVAGELRAKFGMASAMPQARAEHDTRSCGGAWLRGPWATAEPGQASHSDLAPQVWRAPEGSAAVPVGGGGAWPGFEATRRAKLAARTARGRAAAHRHTQRPGPPVPGTPVARGRAWRKPRVQRRCCGD